MLHSLGSQLWTSDEIFLSGREEGAPSRLFACEKLKILNSGNRDPATSLPPVGEDSPYATIPFDLKTDDKVALDKGLVALSLSDILRVKCSEEKSRAKGLRL